ncbi:MAG: InlB B-repeat-containing protein, partial [Oscillospiraceae bacterium]|nr:InlB B-repeat-containing protein [Oscillospiraceae bacterium]
MGSENRKKMKRVFALALALLMVLTLAPPEAFAVPAAYDAPYYDAPAYDAPDYAPIDAASLAVPLSERPANAVAIRNWTELLAFLNASVYPWNDHSRHFYLDSPTGFINAPNDTLAGFPSGSAYQHLGRPGIFTGTFDGNNQEIRGLQIRTRTGTSAASPSGGSIVRDSVGFIRAAGDGAVIRDLTFASVTQNGIGGSFRPSFYATGLATHWNGQQTRAGIVLGRAVSGTVTIQNVHLAGRHEVLRNRGNSNDMDAISGFVGGTEAGATLNIIDISTGSLELRSANGRTGAMGGVVGLSNGRVNITASDPEAPSVIRVNIRGGGANAVNNNDNDNPTRAGGIIGSVAAGHAAISNVRVEPATQSGAGQANQQIRARVAAGGVVGWTGASGSLTINNVENMHHGGTTPRVSTIVINGRVGGIVGHARNNTRLTDVTNHAFVENLERQTFLGITTVSANNANVGGIVGAAENTLTITDATNHGRVLTRRAAPRGGGIVGRTTRATTLINVVNTAEVRHETTDDATANLGGIVGRSEQRLAITGAWNSGNVTRTHGTGTGAHSGNNCHVGGIVGDMRVTRQHVVLTDVTNTGNINGTAVESGSNAMRNASVRAGGIVGNVQPGGGTLSITDATNWGAVRALWASGGIIGRDASPNTRITGAINNGLVHTIQNQRIAGGIIGDATRAGLLIRQSGNNGEVVGFANNIAETTVWPFTTNVEGRAGFGGIIGRSAANHRIEQSFNAGFVRVSGTHSNPRTGGIVGQNRRNLVVQDSYNIGDIQGTAGNAGDRSRGSGIVGERNSGNITIERVFVAGNIEGQVVAQSNTGGPAGGVAGIRFNQVYVDQTATRVTPRAQINEVNLLQGNRPGVTLVNTELMTSGLLPGLNRYPWMYDIHNIPCDYQRTYPFLAWQTNGQQEPQFFGEVPAHEEGIQGIRPHLDSDDPNTQNRTVEFYNVQLLPIVRGLEGQATPDSSGRVHVVRTFNAYNRGAHLQTQHVLNPPSLTVNNVGVDRLMSIGLITPNTVVGFTLDEPPRRFQVIGVHENYIADGGFQIGHALFESEIATRPPGLEGMEGVFLGCLDDLAEIIEANGYVYIHVTAVGYAPESRRLEQSDLDALIQAFESGERPPTIEIIMTPIPIDIQVWVRGFNPPDTDETDFTGFEWRWALEHGALLHEGASVIRQPSTPPSNINYTGPWLTRSFLLEDVFVQELLTGSAPQWSTEEVPIDPGLNFRHDLVNGGFLQVNVGGRDRYVIDIFLDNISLDTLVNVQVYGFDGYDDDDEPRWIPLAIGTDAARMFNMDVSDYSLPALEQPGAQSRPGTPNNRFILGAGTLFPTENTMIQIVPTSAMADLWMPSDVLSVASEMYVVLHEETGEPIGNPIVRVFLRPVLAIDVHVVREIPSEGDGDPTFEPIADASLALEDSEGTLRPQVGENGIFTNVRVGEGSRLRAEALGYLGEYYIVSSESIIENGVLFIILRAVTFELTYDANGGEGGPDPNPVVLSPGTHELEMREEYLPTHPDYAFVGWSLTPITTILDVTDTSYLEQIVTEVTITDEDVTVYAVWGYASNGTEPDILRRVEVLYHPGTGTGTTEQNPVVVLRGDTYHLRAVGTEEGQVPFSKEGHNFTGWLVEREGQEPTVMTVPGSIELTGDMTLTAQWTLNSFMLTISNVPVLAPLPTNQTPSGYREFGTEIVLNEGTAPA